MIVDSSVWIEILSDGPLASKCEKEFKKQRIKVPTLVLLEVYKKIKKSVSEEVALEAVGMLSNYEILNLTQEVALNAADISLEHELGMADSMMLAFAYVENEILLTLDNDFSGKPNAKVLRN